MSDKYRVVGGPKDGKTAPKAAFPDVAEFETIVVNDAARPGEQETYRREGDDLVFVESRRVVFFVGGPRDGAVQDAEKFSHLPAGHRATIPNDDGRTYAWYRPDGHRMVYEGTTTADGMEIIE